MVYPTHIFSTLSEAWLVGQLKNNMYRCCRIYRLSVSQCRFELNLLNGTYCIFIKTVTQPANNIDDVHFAVRAEQDSHKNFALDLRLSCFIGVVRLGFE